ncbi:FadR/GntR family transcriptional regulator [Tessaracoccus sp. G1721]
MGAVEVARDGLCRMIASGELAPGQVLPSEQELCERLGVSRSSLREAQKMLEVAGALASRPGSRSFVSEMTAADIMSGLSIVVPLLPLERYLALFPMREVLEGHLAATAAARMPPEQAAELLDLGRRLAETPPSEEAAELDSEFHAMIGRGACDEVITELVDTLRRRGRHYRILEVRGSGAELKRLSDEAHLLIATAIAERDPEGARFLMMRHVRTTREWLEGIWPEPLVT